jgi:hypothetical protein
MLNEIHELLACADDVYIAGKNIDTIQKNTEVLLVASKEIWSGSETRRNKGYGNVTLSEGRTEA